MNTADRLVTFFRQRLDDDEAYAFNAFGDHNNAQAEWEEIWSGAVSVGAREDPILCFDSQISRHIVRSDPARVLRDVDAKRRIVEGYTKERSLMDHGHRTSWTEAGQAVRETVLRMLASAYADHPEFDERWRL